MKPPSPTRTVILPPSDAFPLGATVTVDASHVGPKQTKRQARRRAQKIAARNAASPPPAPDLAVQERADTIPPPPPNIHNKPGQPPTLYLYLDDERPCPEGWTACRWPQEVIDHTEQAAREGRPVVMSLDHDLGENHDGARTGYDVLMWLEERAYYDEPSPCRCACGSTPQTPSPETRCAPPAPPSTPAAATNSANPEPKQHQRSPSGAQSPVTFAPVGPLPRSSPQGSLLALYPMTHHATPTHSHMTQGVKMPRRAKSS